MPKLIKPTISSLLVGLVLLSVLCWSDSFLSVRAPVNSPNYLFEGWLNPVDFEQGALLMKEIPDARVFIVGQTYEAVPLDRMKKDPLTTNKMGVVMMTNSCLVIRPEYLDWRRDLDSVDVVIRMQGGAADGIFAHAHLVADGKIVNSFFSTSAMEEYRTVLPAGRGLNSLSLYYDNDYAKVNEGRYLIVQSIALGGEELELDSGSVVFTYSEHRNYTGFKSAAAHGRAYLGNLGIDTNRIEVIEFEKGRINQTLAGAKAFAVWPGAGAIRSLNVVSKDIHSRRSRMTYSKVLGDVEVGVLYFVKDPTEARPPERWWTPYLLRVDEVLSYLGNWFYLTFLY